MSEHHEKPQGEAVNTNVMKLVKTDGELMNEARQITDALIDKMQELRRRDYITAISLDNGFETGSVELHGFSVTKHKVVVNYENAEAKARLQQVGQAQRR